MLHSWSCKCRHCCFCCCWRLFFSLFVEVFFFFFLTVWRDLSLKGLKHLGSAMISVLYNATVTLSNQTGKLGDWEIDTRHAKQYDASRVGEWGRGETGSLELMRDQKSRPTTTTRCLTNCLINTPWRRFVIVAIRNLFTSKAKIPHSYWHFFN